MIVYQKGVCIPGLISLEYIYKFKEISLLFTFDMKGNSYGETQTRRNEVVWTNIIKVEAGIEYESPWC